MDINTTTRTQAAPHRDEHSSASAQSSRHELHSAISTLPLLPLLAHLGPLDVGGDAPVVGVDVVVIGSGSPGRYGAGCFMVPGLVVIDGTGRREDIRA